MLSGGFVKEWIGEGKKLECDVRWGFGFSLVGSSVLRRKL